MTTRTVVKVLALCAAVMLLAGMTVYAQEGTTSATITAGGQVISGDTDSSRFEQYEEWPEGIMLFDASFDWKGSHGFYLSFDTTSPGYQDNSYFMRWGKKGMFKLDLTWDESPRYFSNKARSFWGQVQPDVFNYLNGEVAPVDLRYVRQTGGMKFNYSGLEDWDFNFGYTHETRDGHQGYMAEARGTSTLYIEFASPVDYRTQNYSASANWARGNWFAGLNFNHNKFTNEYPYATVYLTNPVAAANTIYFNLAPDSKATNVAFTGGVRLPYNHRIVATINQGKFSSDTTLLPNVYYTSFNGEVDTDLYRIRITGEPIQWLGYSAYWKSSELKDNSPRYIIGTGTGARGTRIAGYEKREWGTEIHVDPIKQLRFGLEYNHEKSDHQYREFHTTKETFWKATLDLNFAPWVAFKASYTDLKHRDGELNHEFEELLFPPPATIPTTWGGTWFDIEHRDQKIFNAFVVVTPVQDLAITLSTRRDSNEYPVWFGLRNYDYDNWGLDITYAWSERLVLYGSYMAENYDSGMWAMYAYRQAPVSAWENQWGHAYADDVKTYTLGLEFDAVPGRFDFSTDYAYSKGESASAFTFVPGQAGTGDTGTVGNGIYGGVQYNGYPLLWNKYTKWENKFNYHFNKNLSASVAYIMQKYDGNDWAMDIVEPRPVSIQGANLSSYRLLGAIQPDYDADIFQAYIRFTF